MHMQTKSVTIHHVTLRYCIPTMSNLTQKQHSPSDDEAQQDWFFTQVAWNPDDLMVPKSRLSILKLWCLPCSTSKYIKNCSVYMDNCQYIPLLIHSSLFNTL
jgi:hypothetical protein